MAQRLDSWTNLVTGLGDPLRDKRLGASPNADLLRQPQAELLWRGDDMAARIVEKIPQDALRRGFKFTIDPNADDEPEDLDGQNESIDGRTATEWANEIVGPMAEQRPLGPGAMGPVSKNDAPNPKVTDPTLAIKENDDADDSAKKSKAMMMRLKKLQAKEKVLEAAKYERAYGGAAILLGTVDRSPGKSNNMMSRPLNLDFIDELRFLTVLSPMELVPYRYYGDPLAPKFGEVQLWTMVPKSKGISPRASVIRVHESRLIIFGGVRTSRFMIETQRGFGDSILNRCVNHIRNFTTSYDSAAALIGDFAAAIWKMKGLFELLQADAAGLVKSRAQVMSYVRSVLNTTIIDSEEEFERKATPVTGLPELLDRMANRLAAATGMPVTMLMGQAPAGLNATGDADRDWYNENVVNLQTERIVPALERICDVEMHSDMGATKGDVPAGWTIKMAPMDAPSEAEEADINLKNAQADSLMITAGVLHPEEVAASRYGGAESIIKLDPDIRDAALDVMNAADDNAEDMHAKSMEPPPPPAFGAKPPTGKPPPPAAKKPQPKKK